MSQFKYSFPADISKDHVDNWERRPTRASQARRPTWLPSLVKDQDTVEVVEVKPSGCGSLACPKCGWREGGMRNDWMSSQVEGWETKVFLTLTLDRSRFVGPAEAFDWITSHRAISEFLRAFQLSAFIKLEFHEDGWPHWHLLVNKRLPGRRAWEVWTRLAGPGGRHCVEAGQLSRIDFEEVRTSAKGAARYLCKYLGKGVKLPEWVEDRRIRFVSCTRDLQGWAKFKLQGREIRHTGQRRKHGKCLPLAERLKRCGSRCVLVREWRKAGKVVRRQFIRQVRFGLRVMCTVAGQLGLGIAIREVQRVICWREIAGPSGIHHAPVWTVPIGVASLQFTPKDAGRLLEFFDRVAA